jgi:phospholipid/cholesterol/gamma-HCH transport system substrate-binding protein
MNRNVVETALGAVVLIVAALFFYWAYTRSGQAESNGYTLIAKFDQIDGLDTGADVRMSGIKIGKVLSERLDPESFRAVVTFSVQDNIKLPTDTSAAIVSASLLGGKYLQLTPGADEKVLKPGGEITLTQSSINIEQLVGKYIFGSQGSSSGAPGGSPPASGGKGGQGAPAGEGGLFK